MRELPEPDGEHDRVFERGTVVYTRESVLAIQKQAYEDGLRDAVLRFAESSADVDDMFAKIHAAKSFELESVRKSFGSAMLTASQKEQE